MARLRAARLLFPAGWKRVPGSLWVVPVLQMLAILPVVTSGSLIPRNHFWVTQSCAEVERAAAWINARVGAEDFVVANHNIAWLLRCRTAPYMQVVAWYGLPSLGYERGIAHDRFRYEASLEAARFAVVGDIDQRWEFWQTNVSILTDRLLAENWPAVWRGEFYLVLANPRYPPPASSLEPLPGQPAAE